MSKLENLSAVDQFRMALENPKHLSTPDLSDAKLLARQLKPMIYSAPYFEVGNDVMEAALTLSRDHVDILADLLSRCRPPFPRTIIEWDSHHALRFMGEEPQSFAPKRVAVLIEQEPEEAAFYATVMTTDFSGQPWICGMAPISFRFSPDIELTGHHSEVHDLTRERGTFEGWLKQYSDWETYYGTIFGKEPSTFDHPLMIPMLMGKLMIRPGQDWSSIIRLSRHTNMVLSHPLHRQIAMGLQDQSLHRWAHPKWAGGGTFHGPRSAAVRDNIWRAGIMENLGMGRKILGVLALLNAKDREVHWSEAEAPSGSLFTGKRFMPYMSRRRLTLLLPRDQVLRKVVRLAMTERRARRRHPVLGHWCSSRRRGDPTCNHEYENTSPTLKTCVGCGHLVWWRKAHERGDAGVGFVSKEYVLRKRPKTPAPMGQLS